MRAEQRGLSPCSHCLCACARLAELHGSLEGVLPTQSWQVLIDQNLQPWMESQSTSKLMQASAA